MLRIYSIDLGDFNLKNAGLNESGQPEVLRNQDGDALTPTCVYFTAEGHVLFGNEARNAGFLDPEHYCETFKRKMGTDDVVVRDYAGRGYRARDLAQLVLDYAKETITTVTGEPVSSVVITVPANYTDRQKAETEEAGRAAGLDVRRLVPEPDAALVGTGAHKPADGSYLVVDIGSSTTDVSLVEIQGNRSRVISTKGTSEAAGQDITAAIEERVLDAFESKHGMRPDPAADAQALFDLKRRAEQGKHSLAKREKVSIPFAVGAKAVDVAMSRAEVAKSVSPLIDRMLDVVEDVRAEAGIEIADCTDVRLAGGSALFTPIQDAFAARFGRPANAQGEPLFAIAKGAVVLGRMAVEQKGEKVAAGSRTLPPLEQSFRSVTRWPIAVKVLDEDQEMRCAVILPKGAPIPSTQMKPFRLARPGQTDALIELVQGEEGSPYEDCAAIGEFELTGLAAVHDGAHIIEISLRIDDNGMLTAEAYDTRGGVRNELQLSYGNQ